MLGINYHLFLNSVWLVVYSNEFSVWFMVFGLLLMPIYYLPNSLP